MRSLCTIALIVLIGLASYGNVHAQIPAGVWCTGQTVAAGYSVNANITINDPNYTGANADQYGDWPSVRCSSNEPSGQCLIDPNDVITYINNARNADTSISTANKMLVLPNNYPNEYQNLTQDEKVVVLINLERTARGLTAFPIPDPYPPAPYGHPALTWEAHNHAAVLAEFYELNQGMNTTCTGCSSTNPQKLVHYNSIDGNPGYRVNTIPGFTQGTLTASPQGEVETDTQNAENAVYTWLYRDGANGWGHRHALLGVTPATGATPPNSNDNCYTQIGAGFAASPNQAVYAQITQATPPSTVAPPEFFYVADLVGQETMGWQLPAPDPSPPASPQHTHAFAAGGYCCIQQPFRGLPAGSPRFRPSWIGVCLRRISAKSVWLFC